MVSKKYSSTPTAVPTSEDIEFADTVFQTISDSLQGPVHFEHATTLEINEEANETDDALDNSTEEILSQTSSQEWEEYQIDINGEKQTFSYNYETSSRVLRQRWLESSCTKICKSQIQTPYQYSESM